MTSWGSYEAEWKTTTFASQISLVSMSDCSGLFEMQRRPQSIQRHEASRSWTAVGQDGMGPGVHCWRWADSKAQVLEQVRSHIKKVMGFQQEIGQQSARWIDLVASSFLSEVKQSHYCAVSMHWQFVYSWLSRSLVRPLFRFQKLLTMCVFSGCQMWRGVSPNRVLFGAVTSLRVCSERCIYLVLIV